MTFCIDRAGIVGEDGVTHHGVFDLCYLRSIPGLTISAPADEETLRNLMFTAQTADHGPFAIRYPRGKGSNPNWHTPMKAIEIGKGRKLRDGNKLAVLSLGTMTNKATEAIKRLDQQYSDPDIAHYDMIFLRPLDESILHEVGKKGCPIITVEDGMREGGFGSAVGEWMNDHGYQAHIVRIGVPDEFVEHGKVPELMAQCHMDADAIYDAITSILQSNKNE